MKTMMKALVLAAALTMAVGGSWAEESEKKPQATCPVMGGEIDRDVYYDHEGKRIYFCCPGCIGEFKKDPQKYLKVLEERGEEPEAAPDS
jgi:YHS domain-containing protein